LFESAKTFADEDLPDTPSNWWTMDALDSAGIFEGLANKVEEDYNPRSARLREIYRTVPATEEEEYELREEARNLKEATRKEHEEKDAAKKKRKKKIGGEEPKEMLQKCSAIDFTHLAEALLCFHAWYKLGVCDMKEDSKPETSLIRDSVTRMLAMVCWYCPRKKGNGWKLQKFHNILHLAIDVERSEPPLTLMQDRWTRVFVTGPNYPP
jgi:regulator of replication initiation timing